MAEFLWDLDDPLARATGETAGANQALRDYAHMGPGRSMIKLHRIYTGSTPEIQPPTLHLRTLKQWSSRYEWQGRVARWDELQQEEDDLLWQERKRERQEQAWALGSDLLSKGGDLLEQLPRFTRTSTQETRRQLPTGETEIVRVVTIGLNASLSQIAGALRTGVDLLSLATNEPTDQIRLSGAALDAAIDRELRELLRMEREAGIIPEDQAP